MSLERNEVKENKNGNKEGGYLELQEDISTKTQVGISMPYLMK